MLKKYDFDTVYDRTGWDARKWEKSSIDGVDVLPGYDKIPMWVADMDFRTAPTVLTAMVDRLFATQAMGYYSIENTDYFKAVKHWQKTRNDVDIADDKVIGYENSVKGGIATVLNCVTNPGDPVLLHSPAYSGFIGTLGKVGRSIVFSELYLDDKGVYRIDFADTEKQIVEHGIKAMIFCNPHNPSGRVWERWELEQLVELCHKLGVTIISDEIWSDFIMPGHKHIPTQAVSDVAKQICVGLYAPTKTFNLAGLVGAYSIIYNDELRAACRKFADSTCYNGANVMSVYGLIGGYTGGAEWVDELVKVIDRNHEIAYEALNSWDGVHAQRPQGTYVIFADFREFCEKRGKTKDEVLARMVNIGILPNDGAKFNRPGYIRFNMATPTSQVKKAFARLKELVIDTQW